MSGRLIAVVGPSGAGKDTLLAGLLARNPGAMLVRRAITRPADAGGEAHDAMTEAEFDACARSGGFLAHWAAHGLRYGIPRAVLNDVGAGRVVLFNGSRTALGAVRAAFPSLEVVLIDAPAPLRAARLAARGRETQADILARLERGALPPPTGAVIVMNDADPAAGIARLEAALSLAAAGA